MKKKTVSKEFLYILGFALDALGGAFVYYSGYGMTPMTAFPLVLNDVFPGFSIGTMNFFVQVVVLLFILLLTRKFSIYYISCFVGAFIYDAFLDIFIFVLKILPNSLVLNTTYLILNIICVGAAIALYMRCSMPLMPFDVIVKEISNKFDKKEGVVKIGCDLFFLLSAIIISFFVFNEIRYVGFATVICAITIGFATDVFLTFYDLHFEYKSFTKIGVFLESLTNINENSKIKEN